MISSLPDLNVLEKSVKLTALLQSFHSFSSCLSDLSWLFSESLHIIQQFARESAEYYRERKSKRIRIDNIEKEYLTLKLRFDSLDLSEIQIFIQELVREQNQRRKPSFSLQETSLSSRRNIQNNHNANPRTQNMNKKQYQSSTFRDLQTLPSSRITELTEREVGRREREREQELTQKLFETNEEMKHVNYQISRFKQENDMFREQILEMKKHIVMLTDIVHSKRVNELSAVEKIKGVIKMIKEKSNQNPNNHNNIPHLDRILYGLIQFQSRLKQNANDLLSGEYYESMECQQTRRNQLMLQINTMMREINDLKDERMFVEEQIEQLGELYQQKRTEGKSLGGSQMQIMGATQNLGSINTLGCNCGNVGDDRMLLLQAIAIEKLLSI